MRNSFRFALLLAFVSVNVPAARAVCPGDPTNLICNGGLEMGVPASTLLSVTSFDNCPSYVTSWCASAASPDLFIRNSSSTFFSIPNTSGFGQLCPGGVNTWNFPAPGNDRYAGGYWDHNNYVEGLYTKLDQPLVPGQTYRLTFHAITVKWLGGTIAQDAQIAIGFTQNPPNPQLISTTLDHALPQQLIQLCNGTNNWTTVDVTFTAPANPNLNYFVVEPVSASVPGRRQYVFYDDFRLEAATATVSGTKFLDGDGDGVFDAGESPLPGWTITATDGNGNAISTVTDAAGNYLFAGLAPGTYFITEALQPGWMRTYPPSGIHTLTLMAGGSQANVNFGNRLAITRGCVIPPDDMLAWWTFDETAGGIAHDRAGADAAGIHVGSPVAAPGKVASAISLNGATQYVIVADGPDIEFNTGDFSIDAWIRTTGTGVQTIADKRDSTPVGYAFFVVDGRLGLQLGDRSGSSICSNSPTAACTNFIVGAAGPLVNDGDWHHVAAALRRTGAPNGTLYVDGVARLTFDPSVRPLTLDNAADLWIGRHHPNGSAAHTDVFDGAIDEVEIFGRELLASEVQDIYRADKAGKCKTCGTPSLIQGNYFTQGNFEVVAPRIGGGITHYWRNNDDPSQPWAAQADFALAEGQVGAVSMIQSNYFARGNFEVVARIGNRLAHFWRDNDDPFQTWHGPTYFATGVRGSPSLIQSNYFTKGNFEVVAALETGGIAHYWRNNDDVNQPWTLQAIFATSEGLVDDVALIQSTHGSQGNFEVVARIGDQLAHFWRDNDDPLQTWHGPTYFGTGISGAPGLIQERTGIPGHLEVVAPLSSGGMVHYQRENTLPYTNWGTATIFAQGTMVESVALIQSNYGDNFEVIAQLCGRLEHYWRDSTPAQAWHGPAPLP